MPHHNHAPGKPGIAPTWCSSAKDMVTTALGSSQLWVTLGYGIINEVFWPSTGQPQIRDLGFLVAGHDKWFELKRLCNYTLETPGPFVPLPKIVHHGDDFTVTLEIVPDDLRDVVLIRYHLEGDGYNLYPLLAPRLGVKGTGNTAWTSPHGLIAHRGYAHLCLRSNCGYTRASAGYVGRSDGWQDFKRNGRMTWTYDRAEQGNVALMGELAENHGVLALALALSNDGAQTLARSSLAEGFGAIHHRVSTEWQKWGDNLHCPSQADESQRTLLLHSAMVIKVCDDRHYPGAVVASLSVPWGNSRDDLGGYHLVWARDSVQAGLAMLAADHYGEARKMAAYLVATQLDDGHWTQNFYPDGSAYWTGIQLDEVGFPILLVAKLNEEDQLDGLVTNHMIHRAAGFLVRSGPISPQDRWEENAGVNPFTLAIQIAALVAAAEFLTDQEHHDYLLSLADYLYARIDDWLYVRATDLSRKYGVDGYYIRIASPDIFGGRHGDVTIANRGGLTLPAEAVVSLDFLYLARLGLRRSDDPRMLDTLKVSEGELRVETPNGPSFHRYTEDGYGEHEDGGPFDGTGRGRLWPLLTGERGHFALQCSEDPTPFLEAMSRMTGRGNLLPEQVWDTEAIKDRHLYPGKPTGSAMPLLWAHAEYIKLVDSIDSGQPIEMLAVVKNRYLDNSPHPKAWHWRTDAPFAKLPADTDLIVESTAPFRLHYGFDDWLHVADRESEVAPFGMHIARFKKEELSGARQLDMTLYYEAAGEWEGEDHTIQLS